MQKKNRSNSNVLWQASWMRDMCEVKERSATVCCPGAAYYHSHWYRCSRSTTVRTPPCSGTASPPPARTGARGSPAERKSKAEFTPRESEGDKYFKRDINCSQASSPNRRDFRLKTGNKTYFTSKIAWHSHSHSVNASSIPIQVAAEMEKLQWTCPNRSINVCTRFIGQGQWPFKRNNKFNGFSMRYFNNYFGLKREVKPNGTTISFAVLPMTTTLKMLGCDENLFTADCRRNYCRKTYDASKTDPV